MAYTKNPTWQSGVAGGTKVTPAKLNHIEDGLEAAASAADVAQLTALEAEAAANAASVSAANSADSAAASASLVNSPPDAAIALAVQGAGSQTRTALNATYTSITGTRFMALGDSISTAESNGSGGAGNGVAWAHMACALSQQRLNYAGMAGVSGETSGQILARVPAVLAGLGDTQPVGRVVVPQIVTVLAGTNDLTLGVSFGTWSANIIAIATQLRAANVRVVLCTIPPRGNTTFLAEQLKWNTWLKGYAQAQGYDVLDFFSVLAAPSTGMFAAGYDSGDGLHPSVTGHLALAQHVASTLTTAAYSPIQALSVGDTQNLIANPLMTTGSPVPDSWIPGGSALTGYTESLVTDTEFGGKSWEWNFTAPSANGSFRTLSSYYIAPATYAVGDLLAICVRAKVMTQTGVAASPSSGFRFQSIAVGGSTVVVEHVAGDTAVHGTSLFWFTRRVPAGTTDFQVSAVVAGINTTSTFRLRLGNFGIYNLTRLGLA